MNFAPLIVSLKTATCSIFFTFILGILAAWFVIGRKNEKIKIFFDGLFTLPLVLPPTVAGFMLLYVFGVYRPVGKFFIDVFHYKIAFSWSSTVLAAVVMSFPLMYRSSRGAFEQVDPDLMDAGRTLGMSEWNIFWHIQFANARPGILSGAILAFARGLGEFGATAMIAGNIAGKTRTLPMAVYSEVASGNFDGAYQYVYILIIIASIAIILMNVFEIQGTKKRRRKS